jgi:UBX domain-containing protein 1
MFSLKTNSSGLSIQNPGNSAQDEVQNIMKAAMRNSASHPAVDETPQMERFGGTGYTLGSESAPSRPIIPPGAPQARSGPVRRQLTLWRNGFNIDDGRLFPFTDPESIEILREIRMGRVPRNVAGVQLGEDVEMKLVNREGEDYVSSRPSGNFHGQGNRLGRFDSLCSNLT